MIARFLTGTNPVAAWLRLLFAKWSVRADAYFFLRDDKESEALLWQRSTAPKRLSLSRSRISRPPPSGTCAFWWAHYRSVKLQVRIAGTMCESRCGKTSSDGGESELVQQARYCGPRRWPASLLGHRESK